MMHEAGAGERESGCAGQLLSLPWRFQKEQLGVFAAKQDARQREMSGSSTILLPKRLVR
jgi:hypothetical protein